MLTIVILIGIILLNSYIGQPSDSWEDGRLIVYYHNYLGEYWWGEAKGYWYYYKEEK